MTLTATYSPEDNKLRLYSACRLDEETYATIREAGFRWAPKQDLFVAPMWTPEREDVLLDLCGEIGDEGTSLVERAEERAERFDAYSEKRARDAERAKSAVSAIADGIPLGQPILVGHHSERRARKDAERIENGTRKAVSMWRTSKYWTARAAGVLRDVNYKAQPEVRARRIKRLEADLRKQTKNRKNCGPFLEALTNLDGFKLTNKATGESATRDQKVKFLANHGLIYGLWSKIDKGEVSTDEALAQMIEHYTTTMERADRWTEHLSLRLDYEKALLAEQDATHLLDKPKRPKQPPLCNYRSATILCESPYRGEDQELPQVEMTKAEYAAINKDYKGTRTVEGSHRVRSCVHKGGLVCVFLTDSKVHERPNPAQPTPPPPPASPRPARKAPERTEYDDIEQSLREGVQVVSAPQLFPTPKDVASAVVDLAQIEGGHRVLEPSAGTGSILGEIRGGSLTAVEVNPTLADGLRSSFPAVDVRCCDFLGCNGELGTFDRIVMNPPFEHGADIRHIQHARHMLKPGGRLVAICANGPRQQEQLRPEAVEWIDLEAGTFAGTNVRAAILVIEADHA